MIFPLRRKPVAQDIDDFLAAEIVRSRRCTYFKRLAAAALLVALLVWVLFGVVFAITTVRGSSMNPTLQDGDVVLSWRLGTDFAAGDVVIIDNAERRDYIKRIIGVPGDTIDIDEETGVVFRNGRALDEPYAAGVTLPRDDGLPFPVTLGEEEYLLLGDNRIFSYDSRDWGLVRKERIRAKVILPSI